MDNSNQPEVNYDLSFLRSPKWLMIYFGFGLFLILSNLNLESKIDKLVYSSLKVSPSCQIQIRDYEINFFPLPHLQFNKVNVPGNCLGRGQKPVFLDELAAYFRGPSFSPFGVLFKVETIFEKVPLEVFITAGFSAITVVITESLIPLEKLNRFSPMVKFAGKAKLDFYLELKKMQISKMNVNLRSKSFTLPPNMLIGKSLPINDLQFVASGNLKSLKIKNFVLGNEDSPIRSDLKGVVKLSPSNPMFTELNLKGELAISKEFAEDNALIVGFLDKFDKKDNFYQIELKGPISQISQKFMQF